MRAIRSRLTYANVASSLALFIALAGGTAYAANEWTGENIVDGSLTSADYKNNDIRSGDVRDGTLVGGDVADESLTSADIKQDGILSGDVKNETLHSGDIGNNTIQGIDITDESLTSADIKQDGILSGDVKNETLHSGDIGNNTIQGIDITDGTLTSADINPSVGGHAYWAEGITLPLSVSVPAGQYVVLGQASLANNDSDPQFASCRLQGQANFSVTHIDGHAIDTVPINGTTTLASPGAITMDCGGFAIINAAYASRLTVIRVSGVN